MYDIPDSAEPKLCACGTEFYFVQTPTGTVPVTSDGVSHFLTCSKANEFSRSNKAATKAATAPPRQAKPAKFPSKDNPPPGLRKARQNPPPKPTVQQGLNF